MGQHQASMAIRPFSWHALWAWACRPPSLWARFPSLPDLSWSLWVLMAHDYQEHHFSLWCEKWLLKHLRTLQLKPGRPRMGLPCAEPSPWPEELAHPPLLFPKHTRLQILSNRRCPGMGPEALCAPRCSRQISPSSPLPGDKPWTHLL